MVKLSDILDGRRGYLEQLAEFHADPTMKEMISQLARSRVEALQGMKPEEVLSSVRTDYNLFLAQMVQKQATASDPAACDMQISYLQGELRKLKAWIDAGLPE